MRIELIHPLLVHFPIALLSVGTILRALAIFLPNRFLQTSWIVLAIGACFAWLAVIAGEFAAKVVGPDLCNRSVLHSHEDFAYTAAFLFSGALILDGARHHWIPLGRYKIFSHKILSSTLCFILYLTAAAALLYVGALGARLVFEQGAAVEKYCKS